MTSEVMVERRARPQVPSMNKSILLPAAVLAPFFAYSVYCAETAGFFGYVPVITGSAWGIQVGLDLLLALSLFVGWMVRDAREQGLPAWPFVALILPFGSIGALAYLIVRAVKATRSQNAASAPAYENG